MKGSGVKGCGVEEEGVMRSEMEEEVVKGSGVEGGVEEEG